MTSLAPAGDGEFDVVDIRQIPDDQLEDLLGGLLLGPMVPHVKVV